MNLNRGYFGCAVYHPKREVNVGSLVRTAHNLGASFLAVIGARYQRQASDTVAVHKRVPLFQYTDFQSFRENLPHGCALVGVENTGSAIELSRFDHPHRAVYLLGAEDNGLPEPVLNRCHLIVGMREAGSLNMAVAGSIVLYHRAAEGRNT